MVVNRLDWFISNNYCFIKVDVNKLQIDVEIIVNLDRFIELIFVSNIKLLGGSILNNGIAPSPHHPFLIPTISTLIHKKYLRKF